MDEQQIQLGLHLALLAFDRYTILFRQNPHPMAALGAGFLMSRVKGKEFVSNAEVVEALKIAFQIIPDAVGDVSRADAPGFTNGYTALSESQFVSATLKTLDLLRGLRYVPATNSYLVMQDFYNYY